MKLFTRISQTWQYRKFETSLLLCHEQFESFFVPVTSFFLNNNQHIAKMKSEIWPLPLRDLDEGKEKTLQMISVKIKI
jgi:hypothetical protein